MTISFQVSCTYEKKKNVEFKNMQVYFLKNKTEDPSVQAAG